MAQETVWKTAFLTLVVGVVLGAVIAVSAFGIGAPDSDPAAAGADDTTPSPDELLTDNQSVQQLGSTAAFHEYVRKGQDRSIYASGRVGAGGDVRTTERFEEGAVADDGIDGADGEFDAAPSDGEGSTGSTSGDTRVGETNVQVAGLDEPDMVKTDGENFYYAPQTGYYYPVRTDVDWEEGATAPRYEEPDRRTHVIDTEEPADPAAIANIDASGDMLQSGDRLVILDEQNGRIVGYDISDPANPSEAWNKSLENQVVTARESGGQLFVVTQTAVGPSTPCPIEPMGGEAIACADVYAPDRQAPVDSTYTAFSMDAESGTVDDSVSMMGTGQNTVVYMSPDSLYLTYTTGTSQSDLRAAWASESTAVPASLEERILEIHSYNISERSKQSEIELAIQDWLQTVPKDERNERGNEIREDFEAYLVDHQEKLTQTSVVRIDVDDTDLSVEQTGTVPGEPLNQFALDEYEGTLRVTTTIPRTGGADSYNNLYVLDKDSLDQEDAVTGMGEDQRVYAVRYVDDTAYVVTFRQVDPFYVIDFEDPTDPEKLGKLKLPGYSEYLHPVNDDYVIGIGEEDWNVKAALFDVSDPTDPQVADDMKLQEGWSAISNSHHAFTIDRKHGVFFLPAGNSGKVVDYTDGELELKKEVQANANVERARYVGDYLYVFAGQEIIVIDETNWTEETRLELDGKFEESG